jgi:hypothetical protein
MVLVRAPWLHDGIINMILDQNVDADTRDLVEKAGSHLYGLLHARYILTSRGLQKMVTQHLYSALLILVRGTNT